MVWRKLEQRKAQKKDQQIHLLQQQLAAARQANAMTSQATTPAEGTNTSKKSKRRK